MSQIILFMITHTLHGERVEIVSNHVIVVVVFLWLWLLVALAFGNLYVVELMGSTTNAMH